MNRDARKYKTEIANQLDNKHIASHFNTEYYVFLPFFSCLLALMITANGFNFGQKSKMILILLFLFMLLR